MLVLIISFRLVQWFWTA